MADSYPSNSNLLHNPEYLLVCVSLGHLYTCFACTCAPYFQPNLKTNNQNTCASQVVCSEASMIAHLHANKCNIVDWQHIDLSQCLRKNSRLHTFFVHVVSHILGICITI